MLATTTFPSIAIVDDDESILDSLEMVLENQHWDTQTYISGSAFLADFGQYQPDCIILDAHFPGLRGVEVVKSIKSLNKTIPIIILTAYPKAPETLEIEELGVVEVLAKPITAEILIEHVERILV
ncbi:hypothetical protein GCM10009133_13650 [Cocleimonas flava]|uniref:Response regulator receiver domain-containing protein n=1 Tax=Cocleimonas flava TaxID=634765 RepID=A0A4R1F4Y8_9GAMM|nr:response regulator [Cocleimonas flava]TCJ87732.1 response regulator receiver domain-containing protein [Cocleimonas flava]